MDIDFEVSTQAEFFVTIGEQGGHSFFMLGVIDNAGTPRLLARVGKTYDIDFDVTNGNYLRIGLRAISKGTLARMRGERIHCDRSD